MKKIKILYAHTSKGLEDGLNKYIEDNELEVNSLDFQFYPSSNGILYCMVVYRG